ncbi:SDR family oxidoreductase [Nocardia colli]|uniref:3-oxoacyl-[acyl-carrier-protein] reductase MabA n=1 Tax=Nocardia colli TaxID=2545717 RepID=A0A5N0ELY9_9NOCA|nr:SDR family oxidoreductase [Nocardia colli]KAA8889025.1 SDR family oxidoreductase [Nocardia colli]
MDAGVRRVALVTGSSRGLGRAIALRLARDGMALAVNGLRESAAACAVVGTIRDEGGVADLFAADVTDADQVAGLVDSVGERLGPIEVLVLNATGPQPGSAITDTGWEDHLAQLAFFVKSPVLFGRTVIPGMQERRFGRVVTIDSEVAHRPPPGHSPYAVAKNAQIGVATSWARELAPFGITVNSVAPGYIPFERHDERQLEVADMDTAGYLASVPVGRMGTVEDIAHEVSFLASDGAGFVTGQRIVVDGGRALGA